MKKVLIIGAGPAGLTAAYKLLKSNQDIEVTILEASENIGGISRTYNYKNNRMDIGGHRFFSKDKRVTDLWNEIMPMQGKPAKDDIILNNQKKYVDGGPDPEKEDRVMLLRRRVSRIFFLRKFFDYPISMKFETFKNMGLKNTWVAGWGYIGSCLHKRKETNLENFYINRFGKPLYEMFFEDYTTKVWGISPKEISADWGAQRVKGLSLFKALGEIIAKPFKKIFHSKKVETSLIEEFSYPKYGPGQLYEAMANEIIKMGGKIIFNEEVNHIEVNNHHIEKIKTNNHEYVADYYISSMPIKDLYNSFDNYNKEAFDVATNLLYRDFITVGLLLPKLKIKNQTKMKTVSNIVPDCWIYIQERDVKVGRLQIFNNWSPYMVNDLENTVFVGLEYFVNENDEMWNMSDHDFIEFAKDELQKIDIIDKNDVIDACRLNVKKAYPAYFGSYKDFDKVVDDLKQFDNLLCVGRNGQHRYNNMDHSMVTAMIASEIILNNNYTQDDLWSVNTEKEYHETKGDNNAKSH
ncbi:MAG: NAD(P)/FAD-dependent oxidoreductase [Bacilli bacterium]